MFANRQQEAQAASDAKKDSLPAGESQDSTESPAADSEIRLPAEDVSVRRSHSSIPKTTQTPPAASPLAAINQRAPILLKSVEKEAPSESKEEQKLVVGPEIKLKGEISNCGTLVVQGHLDGSAKSQMVQVAEGGAIEGDLEVATAEISGRFEGTLTVSQQLNITSTGVVVGTIRYADIHIDAGGQISGDIQVLPGDAGSS